MLLPVISINGVELTLFSHWAHLDKMFSEYLFCGDNFGESQCHLGMHLF